MLRDLRCLGPLWAYQRRRSRSKDRTEVVTVPDDDGGHTVATHQATTGPALDLGLDDDTEEKPDIYPDRTLVLVGCGKAKRDPDDPVDLHEAVVDPDEQLGQAWQGETGPAWEAQDLYTSNYFHAKRELAEAVTRWNQDPDATPWAILSAEHQLLQPWETVTPYDTTIDDLGDDPTNPDHRVDAGGRRRPDGQEIVTEMDKWATGVAYGLARWMAMFRDDGVDAPHTTDATSLLVLAGQSYIEPLRERGVFDYGISRMAGDVNEIHEFPTHVRYLFEEIDAEGIGEQMAWMSDQVDRFEHEREATEQADLIDSVAATDGGDDGA